MTMSRIAYLYCDSRSLNDATNYYVGLIRDCLKEKGYSFRIAHNISDIKNPSVIMTITGRYFCCEIKIPIYKNYLLGTRRKCGGGSHDRPEWL